MLADDDAMYRSAVEAEEAVHTPPAVTAVPPPTEAVPAEAASEAWEEILPADSTREASLDPTPVQHASTPALFGEDGEQTATPPPSVAASSPARAAAPSVAASSPARAAAPLPPFPLAGDRISIGGERGVVIQANIKIPSQLAVVYDRQPLGWHLIDLLSPNMPRFGSEGSHILLDEVELEFSVRSVIRGSRGARLPTAYLLGPTRFSRISPTSPQYWQFYGGISPAIAGPGGQVEIPISPRDEVTMGHHVQYHTTITCSWVVEDAAGDDTRPLEGEATLYAVLVGWDGNQRRQYALLQPTAEPSGVLFLVSWDAVQGRHPSMKAATRMESMLTKKEILTSLSTEMSLRSPSSVHAAMNRCRKRREEECVYNDDKEGTGEEECEEWEEEECEEENREEGEEDDDETEAEQYEEEGEEERSSRSEREEEEGEEEEGEEEEEEGGDEDADESDGAVDMHVLPVKDLFGVNSKSAPKKPTAKQPPAKIVPNNLKGWGFTKLKGAATPEVTPRLLPAA